MNADASAELRAQQHQLARTLHTLHARPTKAPRPGRTARTDEST